MSRAHPAYALPGSQIWREHTGNNDAWYRISLWVPPGDPPVGGFPTLILLDADALFGTVVEAVRRCSRRPEVTGIGATAVLGIAHDRKDMYPDTLRRRDYTWGPAAQPSDRTDPNGGGPALLSFLVDQLLPSLARNGSLNATSRTLFGHSLAGLFVLHALAEQPQAFRNWVAVSPSIWWNPDTLQQRLASSLPGQQDIRVAIAAGQWEAELPPWLDPADPRHQQLQARRAARNMVGHARDLARHLRGWLGEDRVEYRLYPEADHASTPTLASLLALRMSSCQPDSDNVR